MKFYDLLYFVEVELFYFFNFICLILKVPCVNRIHVVAVSDQ